MNTDVLVPTLPESVSDATLVAWHKQPGESVRKDENLVDLETDKVVLEVPAPENGLLIKIHHSTGATVNSGDILAVIKQGAEEASPVQPEQATVGTTPQPELATQTDGSPPLSPAVRRLVSEMNINPTSVTGSGKDGRITKSDVLEFLHKQETGTDDKTVVLESNEVPATPVAAQQVEKPTTGTTTLPDVRPEQRVPMTRLRARIAERLIQAQQNSATLTTFNEVNLAKILELRNQYKATFEKQHDIKLGFMAFFINASIQALKKFPIVNASVDGQDIIYHGYYDIGIAVSSDRGLVVPVLRDADQMDFAGTEKSIAAFAAKAREGKLTLDDLTGGTFTITNGGVFGSLLSTPILNPPQSAILGMHATNERPVVENGEVVVRPIMNLALSYDHRVIDGREAVQFLVAVKNNLEDPTRLLLNV